MAEKRDARGRVFSPSMAGPRSLRARLRPAGSARVAALHPLLDHRLGTLPTTRAPTSRCVGQPGKLCLQLGDCLWYSGSGSNNNFRSSPNITNGGIQDFPEKPVTFHQHRGLKKANKPNNKCWKTAK